MGKSFIRMSNIDFFPSLIKEKKFIDTLSNLTIYVDEQSDNKKQFNEMARKSKNVGFLKLGNIFVCKFVLYFF